MTTSSRWLALLIVMLIALISCKRQLPPRVLTTPSIAANSLGAYAAREPSPTLGPLPGITLAPSVTPSATRTRVPTETPTIPLPTPTPFILSDPRPSDTDVIRFLFNSRYSQLPDDLLARLDEGDARFASRQEVDVDGDGKNELVISGYLDEFLKISPYFAILKPPPFDPSQRPSGQWQELFFALGDGGLHGDHVYVTYAPDTRQIVVDFVLNHGMASTTDEQWYERWVRCGSQGCREVWSGERMHVRGDQAMTTENSREYTYSTIDRLDESSLEITSHHFATRDVPQADSLPADLQDPLPTTKRVSGPDVLEKYDWDGAAYRLTSRQEISPGVEITRQFDFQTQEAISWLLSKLNPDTATFWGVPTPKDPKGYEWESDRVWPLGAALDGGKLAGFVSPKYFPLCRISVHQFTGEGFELIGRADVLCIPGFARLGWADVDGDGNDDLLVMTYKPHDVGIAQLIVFRVQRGLSELTHVEGAINGEDGVGIKWEKRKDGFVVYAGVPLGGKTIGNSFGSFVPGDWLHNYAPCAIPWENLGRCIVTRYFKEFHWDSKSKSFIP